MKEKSSSSEAVRNLPAKEDLYLLLSLYNTDIYYYILAFRGQHPPMPTIEFNNEYDVILWTLSRLIEGFEKKNNLFAGQCIWVLACIIEFTEILS